MSRNVGDFIFPANFEVTKVEPLDGRQLVGTKADLTGTTTWNQSGAVWLYDGAIVSVGQDPVPENNGIYFLASASTYTDINSWVKAGTGSGGGTLNMSGNTVGGLTTYVDGTTICAQPNLTFDGTTLATNTNISICEGGHRCIYMTPQDDSAVAANALYIIGQERTASGANVDAGNVHLRAGLGDNTTPSNGGDAFVCGGIGCAAASGSGGNVNLRGGLGCTTATGGGVGGCVLICAGDGLVAGGTGTGGHVCIKSGDGTTTDGTVYIHHGIAQKFNTATWGINVIGTLCATSRLESSTIKLTSGAASGCVLQSDADGLATWATPAGGGVSWTGTQYADGIATYVGASTMCSETGLRYNGTELKLTGNICLSNSADRCICMGWSDDTASGNALILRGVNIDLDEDENSVITGGAVCICGGISCNMDSSYETYPNGGNVVITAGDSCGGNVCESYGGHVIICGGESIVGDYDDEARGGDVRLHGAIGDDTCGNVILYQGALQRLSTATYGAYTSGHHCATTCVTTPVVKASNCLRVNTTTAGTTPVIVCSDTNGVVAMSVVGYLAGTGTQTAFYVNQKGTGSGQYTAGAFDAYHTVSSTGGRSTGVCGVGGNRTDGYNIGVLGKLCGTQDGAGVLGAIGSQPFPIPAGCWAGYFSGPVRGTSTICGVTCVTSPITCGTTRVQGVTVCGSTIVRSPTLCSSTQTIATRGAAGGAVQGSNTFNTTSGLGGVVGITPSAGCGWLGHYNGTVRAGVFGFCSSTTTYASTTHAGYFQGCVCINNTLASGYALKIDHCGCAIDFVATSDRRRKKCIEPITSALSKIDCLCGVCYDFCDNDSPDMGLIAQDVDKVEPRLVTKATPSPEEKENYGITDQVYGLKYDKFAGLFVEAIKELKQQNECLQLQINELRKNK